VAVSVASFSFSGGTKHCSHIVITLDIRLGSKIEITAVGLGFPGKCIFKVLFSLGVFEGHDDLRLKFGGKNYSLVASVKALSGAI
jgi:hypothetical protein